MLVCAWPGERDTVTAALAPRRRIDLAPAAPPGPLQLGGLPTHQSEHVAGSAHSCRGQTHIMAWGYWSATAVSDRGRSPRRNQNQPASIPTSNIPVTVEERPAVTPYVNSNNNTVPPPLEFDIPATFSRRPSLDLGHGPQGALAVVMCGAHGPQPARQGPGGTLSAGNTLTRIGSRHTATSVVDYAVPHYHHHHGGYIEYHDHRLSPSDDDDSEPGYATGTEPG